MMKKLLFILYLVLLCSGLFAQTQLKRDYLVEISGPEVRSIRTAEVGFMDYSRERFLSFYDNRLLLLASKGEIEVMRESGFHPVILMQDTSRLNLTRRAYYGESMKLPESYHTYDGILTLVDSYSKTYPDLIRKIEIGKTTQDKKPIYAVKISNNVKKNQDKPGILLNGCHHSDEVLGAEICTETIEYLINNYGKDSEVTKWVDFYEIYIVPVVNVDGHKVVTSGINPTWRKNTRDLNGNGVLDDFDGIDLNRNYDFNWAHGGSGDVGSERYRGEFPFSESENRAMKNLLDMKKFVLSISYHSSGEVIFYPWEWRGRKAPDDSLLTEIAKGLAGSIKTYDGKSVYKAEYGAGTVGQTYPYYYGRYGVMDFVVETGRGTHIYPDKGRKITVDNNMEGVKYIFRRGFGAGLTGLVKDAKTKKPLKAIVWIPAIETEDIDRRSTDEEFGRYYRLLMPNKKYDLHFMKEGYETKIIKGVTLKDEGWTTLDVELNPVKK